jgi:hypothetical protein
MPQVMIGRKKIRITHFYKMLPQLRQQNEKKFISKPLNASQKITATLKKELFQNF